MQKQNKPASESEIMARIIQAQIGSRELSHLISDHMEKYFKRWPRYEPLLTNLEWYHVFLDFAEKLEDLSAAAFPSIFPDWLTWRILNGWEMLPDGSWVKENDPTNGINTESLYAIYECEKTARAPIVEERDNPPFVPILLTLNQRKLMAFSLFSTGMKTGPSSFEDLEDIVMQMGIEKEFEEYAKDWIDYAERKKKEN